MVPINTPIYTKYVFAGFGICFVAASLHYTRKAIRMRSWPSTPARLLKSEISLNPAELMHGGRRMEVTYEYTVEGTTYQSRRITMSDSWLAQGEQAVWWIRRHLGPDARAYYDPRDPGQSVLIRPGFTLPLFLYIFGVGLISAMFWMK